MHQLGRAFIKKIIKMVNIFFIDIQARRQTWPAMFIIPRELVDHKLQTYDSTQMKQMIYCAAACIHKFDRLQMKEVKFQSYHMLLALKKWRLIYNLFTFAMSCR